jgi:hypothetical protein
VAAPCKDPRHPLRQWDRLFDIDSAGVVTVNVIAWNAIWNLGGSNIVNAHTRGKSRNLKKVLA